MTQDVCADFAPPQCHIEIATSASDSIILQMYYMFVSRSSFSVDGIKGHSNVTHNGISSDLPRRGISVKRGAIGRSAFDQIED
jgi:hypothetical protein